MDNKILNFVIFRYHLIPISSNETQLSLFERELPPIDVIRDNKNKYFKEVLSKIISSERNKNPMKLHLQEDDYYLFKIAQRKTAPIAKNFKIQQIENEPYVHVILNNNSNVQKIAISENIDAFSKPDVVKNILKKIFQKELYFYGLNIEIEQLFDSGNFWEYVGKHKDTITFVDFQFIKPNLANISKSLPDVFKDFSADTNSHESHISIKAPEKGVLENISKTNDNLKGLVEYASDGGGSIRLKAKNIRKQLNTKENPIKIQIQEIDIEGAPEQVIKLYQSIVN